MFMKKILDSEKTQQENKREKQKKDERHTKKTQKTPKKEKKTIWNKALLLKRYLQKEKNKNISTPNEKTKKKRETW